MLYNSLFINRKKLLLELRREEVLQLTSRGYSQRDIAKRIGISPSLVNNDLKFLRIKARQNISEYINRILPTEMELSLVRLQQIIKKCFDDIESDLTTTKEKHEAATIIEECTALRLEILGSGVQANTLNEIRSRTSLVSNNSGAGQPIHNNTRIGCGTYEFIVSGNNPLPEQFSLMPSECQDVTVGAGDYLVTGEFEGDTPTVDVSGDCAHMIGTTTAGGNIQAGDTQSCIFLNIEEETEPQTCEECFTAFLSETEIEDLQETSLISLEGWCIAIDGSLGDEGKLGTIAGLEEFLRSSQVGVDEETIQQVVECLIRIFGIQTESEPIES